MQLIPSFTILPCPTGAINTYLLVSLIIINTLNGIFMEFEFMANLKTNHYLLKEVLKDP